MINDLMQALIAGLNEGAVPDPPYQEFPLALVWFELCRLAGEAPPAALLAVVDNCSNIPVPPLTPTLPGFYHEHAARFPDLAD